MVRGKHPYALVLDDLSKAENKNCLYQWAAMLNGGVQQADVPGLAPGQLVLAYRAGDLVDSSSLLPGPVKPEPSEPLLLVQSINLSSSGKSDLPLIQVERATGPADAKGNPQFYNRLVMNQYGDFASYRVLLLPFKSGEALPRITWTPMRNGGTGQLSWPDQQDTLMPSQDRGISIEVRRGSDTILDAKFTRQSALQRE
jgi:hypothetical protein